MDPLVFHRKHKGKWETKSKVPIKNKSILSTVYTPGVAKVSQAIHKNPKLASKLVNKPVAVISDGSSVLGLGNIGPDAAMPVMEGKAVLFKEFADVDAVPIVLDTQDTKEIIKTCKLLAPSFSGINLEDIGAPRCFEIEQALQKLGIPVFHDDQHGTAIVVLAGLINAAKVVKKDIHDLTVVVNGAGAAGTAITKMLLCHGINHCDSVRDVIVCDSKGIIHKSRRLNKHKKQLAKITNRTNRKGTLEDALIHADVFIGVSRGNLLSRQMIKSMAKDPIVFALANPIPEIMPHLAKRAGVKVIATGRSDFPNQVNNVLAFPGVFKGALDAGHKQITGNMKVAAAYALAKLVKNPKTNNILPLPLDKRIAKVVARAVKNA